MRWYNSNWIMGLIQLGIIFASGVVGAGLELNYIQKHPLPAKQESIAPSQYVSFADTTITFNGQKVHVTTIITDPGSFIWNLIAQNSAMNARLRRVEQDTTQIKQMHEKLDALHARFETMRDEVTRMRKLKGILPMPAYSDTSKYYDRDWLKAHGGGKAGW